MTARRTAPAEPSVRAMFDRVVPAYDLVNGLLSLGLDRWWRSRTAAAVDVAPSELVLDLGCGTGRLASRLAGEHRVVGLDLSREMLHAAATRLTPFGRVPLTQGSAFALPFADASFGAVASAFVLRNLHDLPAALSEMARVTKLGGLLALLDITGPEHRKRRRAFETYFGTAAPLLGRLVGRREDYQYLVRSLAQLPPPAEVAALIRSAGFAAVEHRALFPGVVTLWTGVRSVTPSAQGSSQEVREPDPPS